MEGKLYMKIKSAKIVSVFDGMACGMLAFLAAGIKVDKYVAFEIDKYATKTAKHNFPDIEENGDVFQADFTKYEGFDFVVGGSPCTYWSIAQSSDKREIIASGIGWELFQQYVRCVDEVKPKWFIYENNKSMSNSIRMSITEVFGFEPVEINSALVSAQNRQRLYWVGMRNKGGQYDGIKVEQPVDRGILLRDILEINCQTWMKKSYTLSSPYYKGEGTDVPRVLGGVSQSGDRIMAAEPVGVREVGRRINEDGHRADDDKSIETVQRYEVNENPQKTNTLTTVHKDNQICEPVKVGCYPSPDGTLKNSQGYRLYSADAKSVNITSGGGGAGGKTGLYAVPIEFDENNIPTKVFSLADNKEHRVYRVENGQITIKGKQYPIKLSDGYYIIRKLTVKECKKLQTVPDWYEFPVSDSQAYKMLGNGWTVEVIAHLIRATQEGRIFDKQLSFFD